MLGKLHPGEWEPSSLTAAEETQETLQKVKLNSPEELGPLTGAPAESVAGRKHGSHTKLAYFLIADSAFINLNRPHPG